MAYSKPFYIFTLFWTFLGQAQNISYYLVLLGQAPCIYDTQCIYGIWNPGGANCSNLLQVCQIGGSRYKIGYNQ